MPTSWIRAAIKISALLWAGPSLASTGPACEGFQQEFIKNASGAVKECTADSYSEKCFPPERDHKRPFKALNAEAEYVFICTHGLSDSPYYFKDVSSCLLEEGMEVWGLRLEGHVDGNEPSRVAEGSWEKWEKQVECAVEAAVARGKKPVLCGFSTGGTLSLHHAFREKNKIHGLLLFSPAVRLPWLARVLPLGWVNFPLSFPGKPDCGRYDRMYSFGVHYLKQGIAELHALAEATREKINVPLLVYHSTDDNAVLPEATLRFAQTRFRDPRFIFMGKKGATIPSEKLDTALDHSAVLKSQGCAQPYEINPKFDLLCSKIREFAREIKGR